MARLKSYGTSDPLIKYTVDHSIRYTDVQQRLAKETQKHSQAPMMGAPELLQLCANLIQLIKAKKVLDVGVFTGSSSLSAALALPPDGHVHALDVSEEDTNIAKKFWAEAGVSHKITLHLAPATDTLQKFIDDGQAGTFDFAFIDADKPNYDRYYEQCLVLVRPGGVIVFDNTLLNGQVIDPEKQDPRTVAMRKLNEKLHHDERINLSFLKVGDGVSICFVK